MTVPDYLPLAGWYVDGRGELRWWNGTQWTPSTRSGKSALSILAAPTWALLPLALLTGLGWVVCMSIALASLARHVAIPQAGDLLIVGVPLLALGQLQAIAAQRAHTVRRTGSAKRSLGYQVRQLRGGGRQQLFGALPVGVGRAFCALLAVGWLLAMTATIGAHNEDLQPATPSCAFPVIDRGVPRCLTAAQWHAQGADVQRFAAGILSGFYLLGCGSAINTLVLRRKTPAAPPEGLVSPGGVSG